jgi:hypothetical protein
MPMINKNKLLGTAKNVTNTPIASSITICLGSGVLKFLRDDLIEIKPIMSKNNVIVKYKAIERFKNTINENIIRLAIVPDAKGI